MVTVNSYKIHKRAKAEVIISFLGRSRCEEGNSDYPSCCYRPPQMALFSHIFGCFSETSTGSRREYICNGDVCVLSDVKSLNGGGGGGGGGEQKKQQSLVGKISFARLSSPMRKALSFGS